MMFQQLTRICDHWHASSNASSWTSNIILICDRLPHITWLTLHSILFIYFMHAVHNCYWWKYYCCCCCCCYCCCCCCCHDNCCCHSHHHHHHYLNHTSCYCLIINSCEILLYFLQGSNDFQCLHLFYLSGNQWPFLHSSSKPSSPFLSMALKFS